MGWRPDKQLPERGFQGEGILAVVAPNAPARAWFARTTEADVPSIRLEALRDRLVVAADGPVGEIAGATLSEALATVGARLGHGEVPSVPPGWSSWSYYFREVTEADVAENVAEAERLGLPIAIVQVDDGWQAEIGDWLDVSVRFGSLERTAARILASDRQPGIWTAPFLVGERSRLAAEHPDWLVGAADAGTNWAQRLGVLDVTHPGAAAHLEHVYRWLERLDFRFHKLDFLYAGALPGRRREDCSGLDAYREGLRIIREAVAPATLLGCGATLLPSVGHVDAMRVGPDVLGVPGNSPEDGPASGIVSALATTTARAWMHARLWASDPDCVVARAEIADRDEWAVHVESYGGLAFSGDRLSTLDELGLELTRRVLRPSTTEPS
ncbi:MAG: glycoside hydrolase family 36 protein [Gaiellaceae bacterium]